MDTEGFANTEQEFQQIQLIAALNKCASDGCESCRTALEDFAEKWVREPGLGSFGSRYFARVK